MRRYNMHIPRLTELHPQRENLRLGRNDFFYVNTGHMAKKWRRLHHNTHTISIRFRIELGVTQFLPLEELLNTLCHELAQSGISSMDCVFIGRGR